MQSGQPFVCSQMILEALCYLNAAIISVDQVEQMPGLKVIKLEYKLRLKIRRNDWLLADTCPQTANHCALFLV